jgi:hypothetical protein
VTGRVLIEASPCPVRGEEGHSHDDLYACPTCHGTGHVIPSEVSSPVRYEPGTPIELAVKCDGRCDPWSGNVPYRVRCDEKRVVAVALVDECIAVLVPGTGGPDRTDHSTVTDHYRLSLSAVRPPTPEETT